MARDCVGGQQGCGLVNRRERATGDQHEWGRIWRQARQYEQGGE